MKYVEMQQTAKPKIVITFGVNLSFINKNKIGFIKNPSSKPLKESLYFSNTSFINFRTI